MIDTIGMTDIGNGRPSNQDAYLLRQKEKNGKLYLLAVVCDGMGGLKKGEIASHYIVEVLKQWFDETLFDGLETMGIDMIEQNLIDLIRKINQNLLLMSRRMEETKSMGSTLTLLFVEEHMDYPQAEYIDLFNLIEKLRGDIEILKQEIDGGDDEAAEEDIEDIEE